MYVCERPAEGAHTSSDGGELCAPPLRVGGVAHIICRFPMCVFYVVHRAGIAHLKLRRQHISHALCLARFEGRRRRRTISIFVCVERRRGASLRPTVIIVVSGVDDDDAGYGGRFVEEEELSAHTVIILFCGWWMAGALFLGVRLIIPHTAHERLCARS